MKKYGWLFSMTIISALLVLSGNHSQAKEARAYPDTFRLYFISPPTTFDPQVTALIGNYTLRRYLFDPLYTLQNGEVFPILLESYRWKTPTRWEFTLKKGVLFHDGSELTSQDVLATFNRAFRLKNNIYESIKKYQVKVLDTYRFEVQSQQPDSELLWNLEDVVIIKHTSEKDYSETFSRNESLIGTGPYRLLRHKGFKEFHLEAFADYHRGTAFIQQLMVQVEPDSEKRMRDFRDGKVDMISDAQEQDLSGLQDKANIINKPSHLLYHLLLDRRRDQTPYVRDSDGKPLSRNPFQDLRVRQAISKALDRELLLFQLLGSKNRAQIAGQLVNESAELHDFSLLPDRQNISEAKRLLKAAGYPKGFQVTIHDIESRRHYLEAISVMLKQVGIEASVSVLPESEYFKGIKSERFSAMFYFVGTGGNLGNLLSSYLHTNAGENGGYSNRVLDQQIDDAMSQVSIDLKHRKLREAQRTVIADLGIIPIFFSAENWVIRPDMIFLPTDQLLSEAYYIGPNTLE